MNTVTQLATLTSSAILSVLLAQQANAQTFSRPPVLTSNPNGFLTESSRRAPSPTVRSPGGMMDAFCARSTRGSRACPPSVTSGPATAVGGIAANLPHLRLNIILRKMQNVVVAGSGVDSLGAFQEPWATFKIESAAANQSIPGAAADPYGLPVPAPGDTWDDIPHANVLYQGIIHNGCLGPAVFDLNLDSTVYRVSTGQVFGAVNMDDSVDGHGYYNFNYKIRATDESGNVSDFIFSGDADAVCTGQANL